MRNRYRTRPEDSVTAAFMVVWWIGLVVLTSGFAWVLAGGQP